MAPASVTAIDRSVAEKSTKPTGSASLVPGSAGAR